MRILQDAGYNIPEHIRIAGFGDDPIASMVSPPLTTVEQKGYEMGREAIDLLLRHLTKNQTDPVYQTKVFAASLKIRHST
jgi:DNA-binding LacI/PurR family transcriptional regulator